MHWSPWPSLLVTADYTLPPQQCIYAPMILLKQSKGNTKPYFHQYISKAAFVWHSQWIPPTLVPLTCSRRAHGRRRELQTWLEFRIIRHSWGIQFLIINCLLRPRFETQSLIIHHNDFIGTACFASTTRRDTKLCTSQVTSVGGIYHRWYLLTADPDFRCPSLLCQNYHYEKIKMGRWWAQLTPLSLHSAWYRLH